MAEDTDTGVAAQQGTDGGADGGADAASMAPRPDASTGVDSGFADAGPTPGPTPWATFAAGISARETGLVVAGPPKVAIVYGGFGASASNTQTWTDALFTAALASSSIGWLVAVKGPDDARYLTRTDIANSKLAAELTGRGSGKTYGPIMVIAHSSGAYVAEELFSQLSTTAGRLGNVRYYDLDGDARDLASVSAKLELLRFVYAKDGALLSRNASSMQSAAAAFGVTPFVVDATGSGCTVANCLHDAVIISRPYDPTTFDVPRDYTLFTPTRTVVSRYLAAR